MWGVVQQEITDLYQFLLWRKKIDTPWTRFWPYIFELWTYRTQIRLNFMEVLYFKIDHTNNYLKNVSFPIEYNIKSFLKFWR